MIRVNLVQWEGDGNFKEETASDSEPRDFGVAGPNSATGGSTILTPAADASVCFQGSRKTTIHGWCLGVV